MTDQAVSCFAHGLAHLMAELGNEEGRRRAIQVVVSLPRAINDEDEPAGDLMEDFMDEHVGKKSPGPPHTPPLGRQQSVRPGG